MISNDPTVKEFHERAERNARRILRSCCDFELTVTMPSEQRVVRRVLANVQNEFAKRIASRDVDGGQVESSGTVEPSKPERS